jgi:murein DD-endopeptidase MepM/ murein hydrolase activator NlpD
MLLLCSLIVVSFYFSTTLAIGILSGATTSATLPSTPGNSTGNSFDNYLRTDFAPADGFDFPVGDADGKGAYVDKATGKTFKGWQVTTKFGGVDSQGIHPAEDWNGAGGGDTALGQPVFAAANGRVVFAEQYGRLWGNVIVIDHVFYENHLKRRIRSLYAHLQTLRVKAGELVKRRQQIATIGQDPDKAFRAHLHLELRWDETLAPTYRPSSNGKDLIWVREHYAEPSGFIAAHRSLFTPKQEESLILVDQERYKMRLYQLGKLKNEYDISLGQGKGQKRIQGDNKTPKGMYFVLNKRRGQFNGAYGAYYGGYWIKLNYPNRYDAERGRAEGLISAEQEQSIVAKWKQRKATLETTRLGGGIGFHGWAQEWANDGPRHRSWGCVVMHLYDIIKLFDQIPPGAMVVIF